MLLQIEVGVDSTVLEPTQIFTLTMREHLSDDVHPLPEVAKARLCSSNRTKTSEEKSCASCRSI